MNIALAQTTSNGLSEQDASGFTTIVISGTSTSPFGNNIKFDYELGFAADTPFSFSGGALIIRFNAAGAFANDSVGNGVLMDYVVRIAAFVESRDGIEVSGKQDANRT